MNFFQNKSAFDAMNEIAIQNTPNKINDNNKLKPASQQNTIVPK